MTNKKCAAAPYKVISKNKEKCFHWAKHLKFDNVLYIAAFYTLQNKLHAIRQVGNITDLKQHMNYEQGKKHCSLNGIRSTSNHSEVLLSRALIMVTTTWNPYIKKIYQKNVSENWVSAFGECLAFAIYKLNNRIKKICTTNPCQMQVLHSYKHCGRRIQRQEN